MERSNPITMNIINKGYYLLVKDKVMIDRNVKELIRVEYEKHVKYKYTFHKFGENVNLIDIEARYVFPNITWSVLKCSIKFNYFLMRDIIINYKLQDDSCL